MESFSSVSDAGGIPAPFHTSGHRNPISRPREVDTNATNNICLALNQNGFGIRMAIEWFEDKPDGRTIEDLKAWRRTIDDLPNPIHRVFYELLLFTGLRKTEVLTLKWKQIQEDRIHLPMTKNGQSFDLPILQLHHEILAPLRPLSREWVFPSPKSEAGHITRPERLKYNPHMHRRTFATVAMEVGVLEEIVGRLLNHTPLSITGQRYKRPSLEALRPAMVTACDEIITRIEN